MSGPFGDLSAPAPTPEVSFITFGKPVPLVVLARVDAGAPSHQVYGRTRCQFCEAWCWLGNQTYRALMAAEVAPLCFLCAEVHVTPQQWAGYLRDEPA